MSALLLSGGLDVSAQTAPAREYQVKAVFLFNFAQFVDWLPKPFPKRKLRWSSGCWERIRLALTWTRPCAMKK